jgi:hypothetical protein
MTVVQAVLARSIILRIYRTCSPFRCRWFLEIQANTSTLQCPPSWSPKRNERYEKCYESMRKAPWHARISLTSFGSLRYTSVPADGVSVKLHRFNEATNYLPHPSREINCSEPPKYLRHKTYALAYHQLRTYFETYVAKMLLIGRPIPILGCGPTPASFSGLSGLLRMSLSTCASSPLRHLPSCSPTVALRPCGLALKDRRAPRRDPSILVAFLT